MFGLDTREWIALLMIWMAFMTVVGVYVMRIALMLLEQRAVERSFRIRLAMKRRRAARVAAGAIESDATAPVRRS